MKKDFTHTLSTGLVMPSACKKVFLAPETAIPTVTESEAAVSPASQQSGSGYTNRYSTFTSTYSYVSCIYNYTTHAFIH